MDIAWRDGRLEQATIHCILGKPLKIRYRGKEIGLKSDAGKTYRLSGNLTVQ